MHDNLLREMQSRVQSMGGSGRTTFWDEWWRILAAISSSIGDIDDLLICHVQALDWLLGWMQFWLQQSVERTCRARRSNSGVIQYSLKISAPSNTDVFTCRRKNSINADSRLSLLKTWQKSRRINWKWQPWINTNIKAWSSATSRV